MPKFVRTRTRTALCVRAKFVNVLRKGAHTVSHRLQVEKIRKQN